MLLPKLTAPKYADVMLDLEPKLQGILFYGDPHSNWAPLLYSVNELRPKSVFIFGDLIDKTQGPKALEDTRQVLLELLNKQIDVRIVLGNHDADTDAIFNLVFEEFGSLICHGTVLELEQQGLRVACLGGVFRGKIWDPNIQSHPPFYSQAEWLRKNVKTAHFKGGVARKHRTSIFPETFETLRHTHADILITHEAPSTHPFGFKVLDDLAMDLGSKLIIHGHHHKVSKDIACGGKIAVRGLGLAEVWRPNHLSI